MLRNTYLATLAGEDCMPIVYITPSAMPIAHFHAVLTTHAKPGSAVLKLDF